MEVSSIRGLLHSLNDITMYATSDKDASPGLTWLPTMKVVNKEPDGLLSQCMLTLTRLTTILKPAATRTKRLGQSILLPFKKDDIEEALSSIERLKGLFVLALQNDQL